MEKLQIALQVAIALGIVNVWLLRFRKPSAYRGGEAKNMKEEFAAYGLSETVMRVIGLAKITLAGMLLAGIWIPMLTKPAAIGMGVLMLGAIAMHIKVNDPAMRALPAVGMLAMALTVAVL